MTVAEIKAVVAKERPDAEAKRIAANKRKAKADAKAAAQEAVDEKKPTVSGTLIAEMSFYQLSDGSIHVLFDGVEKPFNDKNIEALVGNLRKAANYQK